MFIKKKFILKLLKRKDSNEICLLKRKVIVKLFKRKDSIEICLLKTRLSSKILNVRIPTKYVY